MKKLACGFLCLSASVAFAEVTFTDYGLINGRALFLAGGMADETLTAERRDPGMTEWTACTCRLLGERSSGGKEKVYAFGEEAEAKIVGTGGAVSFRVSADGGASWTEFSYTPRTTLFGTPGQVGIVYTESGPTRTTGEMAFDGNPLTYYEPKGTATPPWPDLTKFAFVDLGAPKRITGIRAAPRDGYGTGGGMPCRIQGCRVELSPTPDFTVARTVCVLPAATAFGIVEATVVEPGAEEPPLVGRYVRVNCGERTSTFNVAELEIIGEDAEGLPGFAVLGTINRTPIVKALDLAGDAEVEAEWKFAGQADYSTCAVRNLGTLGKATYLTLGETGQVVDGFSFRIRLKGVAWWVNLEMPASSALAGTKIWSGTPSSWNKAAELGLDGDPFTYCEPSYVFGIQNDPNAWFGLDLGARRRITGCRLMSRLSDISFANRTQNRKLEVSDRADFSAVSVSVTLPGVAPGTLASVDLPQAVRGRYVRISSAGIADVCNFGEVEFITSDPIVTYEPSVASSDITNAHAVVSWDASNAWHPFVDVFTAPGIGGPWTRQARVPTAAGCWTNENDVVGVKTYYAMTGAETDASSPDSAGLSQPVAYIRSTRADRDPATGALRAGATPFGARNIGGYGEKSYPSRAFDEDIETFIDAKNNGSGDGKVAIGIDLGADWMVTGLRYYPRYNSSSERVGGNALWGSPDGQSPLTAASRLNAAATTGDSQVLWREIVQGFCDLPTRTFFIWGNPSFYGNVGELEVYGYPYDAMRDRLSVADYPVVANRANGVLVTWTPCPCATGYRLERRDDTHDWAPVYKGRLPTFQDATVAANVAYEYRVTATNAAGSACSGVSYVMRQTPAAALSDTWESASALGADVTGSAGVDPSTGAVTLRAESGDVDRYGERGYGVWRTADGTFVATCTASVATDGDVNGETLWMTVRAGEGEGQPFAAVGFRLMKSYDGLHFGSFALRARTAVNGAVEETTGWTTPVADCTSAQLKLTFDGSRARAAVRPAGASGWQNAGTVVFPAAFGAQPQIGLMASTSCGSVTPPEKQWTVTDFESKPIPGVILLVR